MLNILKIPLKRKIKFDYFYLNIFIKIIMDLFQQKQDDAVQNIIKVIYGIIIGVIFHFLSDMIY